MKVYSLNVIKGKGIMQRNLDKIRLIPNYGIESSYYYDKSDKHVSFFPYEVRERNSDNNTGFCFTRFVENICTQGLDIEKVKVGSTVKVGCTIHQVVSVGYECQEFCNMKKYSFMECNACKDIMFTKVISGGIILPEDKIEIIE